MLGILPPHLRTHILIRPRPKTRQIIRNRHRPTRRRQQLKHHPLTPKHRRIRQPKTLLQLHPHPRPIPTIINQNTTTRRHHQLGRRQLIQPARRRPRQHPLQSRIQVNILNLCARSNQINLRGQPLIRRQRRHIRPRITHPMRQKPQPIPQPRSPTTHRKQPHTPLPHHRGHRSPGHTRIRPHRGTRQHDRTSRHHPHRPHPTILKHTFGFLRHANNIQRHQLRDRRRRLNPRPTRTLQPHIRHRQPLLTHKPKLRRHRCPRPLSQQILTIRHPARHQMRKRMPNNLTRGDPPGLAGAGQLLKTTNLPLVRASQSNIARLAKAEQRHGGGRRRAEIQQRLPEPRIHRQLCQPGRHLRIRRPNRRQRGLGLRKRGGRRLVQ